MGLLGDWLGSKRMDDPVRGTAQVVGASVVPENASSGACSLTLVVQADGVAPTPVERTVMAPRDRWPRPGSTLPVTVDRANPERLKVEWDEIPETADVAWQRAQAMAEGTSAQPIALGGGGDLSERLARLAELHRSGLLSEQEFSAAKARLLEGP